MKKLLSVVGLLALVAGLVHAQAISGPFAAGGNFAAAAGTPSTNPCAPMSTGYLGALNGAGANLFPTSTLFHHNVSAAPVDANSTNFLTNFLQTAMVRNIRSLYDRTESDFMQETVEGYPYYIVDSSQPKKLVKFDTTLVDGPGIDDSDGFDADTNTLIMVPLPVSAPYIEGTFGPTIGGTVTAVNYNVPYDKQTIIIDKDACVLYQLWSVVYDPAVNQYTAGTLAVWDLTGGDHQRPYGRTSQSVSGLPTFPVLITGDDLSSGAINHPIAMTAFANGNNSPSYTGAATHNQFIGGNYDPNKLPFGAVLRMKASVDTSTWTAQGKVIANALKTYGAVLVDGGADRSDRGDEQ